MKRSELARFIEDYRDGVIAIDDAKRVAATIRRGGPDAEWLLNELAFAGALTQALDEQSDESFTRSFLERLYAERGADDFTETFERRSATGARPRPRPLLRHLWGLMLSVNDQRAVAPARRRRQRRWLLPVIVGTLVLGAIAVAVMLWPTAHVAIIITADAAVELERDGQKLAPLPGMRLRRGDIVRVPEQQHLVLTGPSELRLGLPSGGVLAFDNAIFPVSAGIVGDGGSLYLARGELQAVGSGQSTPNAPVITPHGIIESRGEIDLVVTVIATSTRVELRRGAATFARHRDGRTVSLTANTYAIASDSSEFSAQQK